MFEDRHCEERQKLDAFSRELFNRRHDIILKDTGNSYLADVIDEMNIKMKELYDSSEGIPTLDMLNRPGKKVKHKNVKPLDPKREDKRQIKEFSDPHIGELNSAELFHKDKVLPSQADLITPEKPSRFTPGGSSKNDFNSKKRQKSKQYEPPATDHKMHTVAKDNDDNQYLKALNSPMKNQDDAKVEKK